MISPGVAAGAASKRTEVEARQDRARSLAGNTSVREADLIAYIRDLPENLLREYLIEHVRFAAPETIDQMVIVLHATAHVTPKGM